MINDKIIDMLAEIHFGEGINGYQKLLDDILSCSKLSEFNVLDMKFNSIQVENIFENASKDITTHNVRPSRFELIFKQTKAVQSSVDFI